MMPAALQLKYYFVAELSVIANREHDRTKPVEVTDKNLVVVPSFMPDQGNSRLWQVTLRIQQQAGPAANAPYFFTVELTGFFSVASDYPDNKVEWMVRTNATSVLFSTAREVLRSAMSQGPYCPLLLPTVSFYTPDTMTLLAGAEHEGKKASQALSAEKE